MIQTEGHEACSMPATCTYTKCGVPPCRKAISRCMMCQYARGYIYNVSITTKAYCVRHATVVSPHCIRGIVFRQLKVCYTMFGGHQSTERTDLGGPLDSFRLSQAAAPPTTRYLLDFSNSSTSSNSALTTFPTSHHIRITHIFTMGFPDFISETGLHILNSWVSTRSYIVGYVCSPIPHSRDPRPSTPLP